MRVVIDTVKSAMVKGRTFAYHKKHNRDAYKLLKFIEKRQGLFNPKHKKLCLEYANDVFGDKKYAPWLFVYSAFSKKFKEGWIPNNYYGQYVIPKINGFYSGIGDRTAVVDKILKTPNSLDICYYVNKLFLDTENRVISDEKIINKLFNHDNKIVFKIENSQQGKGIYFFNKNTFNINTIKKLGNGVFQAYIKQHSFYKEFTKTSVATIRITSVCDDNGNIEPRVGYFRFGRDNDTHVISAFALKVPIDIKTGRLFEDGYYPNWVKTKFIPKTNIAFAGKTLPFFDKCLSLVKQMHSVIPFIRCIGWDIIVDINKNVRIIEMNCGHSGIKFSETVQGPNFKGLNWENLHRI